jgi:hypothetical protein
MEAVEGITFPFPHWFIFIPEAQTLPLQLRYLLPPRWQVRARAAAEEALLPRQHPASRAVHHPAGCVCT